MNQVAADVKVSDAGFDVLTGKWSRPDERACTPAALSDSLRRMDWMPVVVLAVGATLFLVLKQRGQVSVPRATFDLDLSDIRCLEAEG